MPLVADTLTFFGAPQYGSARADQAHAVMFGVSSSLGSTFADSRNGPHFVRRLSQHYVWQSERPTLLDLRDLALDFSGVCDAGDFVGDDLDGLSRELTAFVSGLPRHCVPIAVGGDHSITLPLVSGLCRASAVPFKLVSFDHHLDYQFWSRERDALFHTNVMTHVSDLLGPGQVAHIGVESVQTVDAELRDWYRAYLKRAGAQMPLQSRAIHDDKLVLDTIGVGQDIYLSIDLDVLADTEMRSTPYPSSTGLSLTRLIELVKLIAGANRIIGADIVEFSAPRDDRRAQTLSDAARAAALLLELTVCVAAQRAAESKEMLQETA